MCSKGSASRAQNNAGETSFYDSVGEPPERYGLPPCDVHFNLWSQTNETTICGVGVILYILCRARRMTHAAFVKIFHSYNGHVFTAAEREQALSLYAKSTRLIWNLEGNDYTATPQARELAHQIGIAFYEAPHFNAQ